MNADCDSLCNCPELSIHHLSIGNHLIFTNIGDTHSLITNFYSDEKNRPLLDLWPSDRDRRPADTTIPNYFFNNRRSRQHHAIAQLANTGLRKRHSKMGAKAEHSPYTHAASSNSIIRKTSLGLSNPRGVLPDSQQFTTAPIELPSYPPSIHSVPLPSYYVLDFPIPAVCSIQNHVGPHYPARAILNNDDNRAVRRFQGRPRLTTQISLLGSQQAVPASIALAPPSYPPSLAKSHTWDTKTPLKDFPNLQAPPISKSHTPMSEGKKKVSPIPSMQAPILRMGRAEAKNQRTIANPISDERGTQAKRIDIESAKNAPDTSISFPSGLPKSMARSGQVNTATKRSIPNFSKPLPALPTVKKDVAMTTASEARSASLPI